jgi:hypothetical protein
VQSGAIPAFQVISPRLTSEHGRAAITKHLVACLAGEAGYNGTFCSAFVTSYIK